ncbi:tetratricopeptide repeat-containing sensor histidine kinase [Crocinitomix catalasitica]|uniref:tetratricopeptide repeat-containing sensor histidine kinase n=1 Tax=Crocinitomix catalasitica TaxID=184607 RepID=UPI000489CD0F|nr:sensor histidine kinase [Crocinitomix catalasitica]
MRFLVLLLSLTIGGTNYTFCFDSLHLESQINRYCLKNFEEPNFVRVFLYELIGTEEVDRSEFFKAKCYSKLGDIYHVLGNIDSSFHYLERALKIRESSGYLSHAASTHEKMAIIYLSLGEQKTAFKHLYKSLKTKESIGNLTYLKSIYAGLGNAHSANENYDSAYYYHLKALAIYQDEKDSSGMAHIYNNIGNVFYYKDDLSKAIRYYKDASTLFNQLSQYGATIYPNIDIGVCHYELANYDSSVVYYQKALDVSRETGNREHLDYIYFNLAEAYAKLDMSDSAIVMFQLYDVLRDSIFDQGKIDAILAAEKKYQTKVAIQTAVFEKAEKEKITIEHENKRLIIYILMGTIALILIVIFFVVRNVKQKHRLKELEVDVKNQEIDNLLKDQEAKSYASLLEGQNYERERIAQDLHDRLGGTLSAVKVHFSLMDEKIQLIKQENKDLFDKVNSMLNEAVQDVRRISHDLSSGRLAKLGLRGALKDLAAIISSAKNIEVEFYMDESLPDFDKKKEQSIYAIVQELVSNMLKHANATSVEIQLNKQDDQLNLLFEDNGVGFDMQNQSYTGLGISGLSKRVEALDGTINFDSVVGRGTIVIINIPL